MDRLILALYDDVVAAQKAVDSLVASGVPSSDVSILSNETIAAIPGAVEEGETGPLGDADVSGADLVSRLTRYGVDRGAAEAYAEGVRRHGALVAVRATETRADAVAGQLDRAGALDYAGEVRSWQSEGWAGYDPAARPLTPAEADMERRRRADRRGQSEGERATEAIVRRSTIYTPPD